MIKFLTTPRTLTKPDNSTYTVDAISVSIFEQDINYTPALKIKFTFYNKDAEGNFISVSEFVKPNVYKKVTIPNVGDIDFVAGLFSYDKTKVYQVASIFAQYNGYTLLPINEQTDLQLM